MIEQKQIRDLEEIKDNAFVSAEQDANGTVTLTRGNGLSLSFSTNKDIIGVKGDIGEKGQKGVDGLSAYELAVLQGYRGTELRWRRGLIGPKGYKGRNGTNGINGVDGKPIVLDENVTVKKGTQFSVKFEDNTMIFTLPDFKKGIKGLAGKTYRIVQAQVIEGDNFNVKTTWNGYRGSIIVTLPSVNGGVTGVPGVRIDGTSPTLDKVEVNRVLPAGSLWSCVSTGLKTNVRYSFELSAAKPGLQGEQGDVGVPGAVTGNLIPVKEDKISADFASFVVTDNGILNNFNFGDINCGTVGFDIKDGDIRYQNKFVGDTDE